MISNYKFNFPLLFNIWFSHQNIQSIKTGTKNILFTITYTAARLVTTRLGKQQTLSNYLLKEGMNESPLSNSSFSSKHHLFPRPENVTLETSLKSFSFNSFPLSSKHAHIVWIILPPSQLISLPRLSSIQSINNITIQVILERNNLIEKWSYFISAWKTSPDYPTLTKYRKMPLIQKMRLVQTYLSSFNPHKAPLPTYPFWHQAHHKPSWSPHTPRIPLCAFDVLRLSNLPGKFWIFYKA